MELGRCSVVLIFVFMVSQRCHSEQVFTQSHGRGKISYEKDMKTMSALDTPLTSPETGLKQLTEIEQDHVNWAPSLSYKNGFLYFVGGDWRPQSAKVYRMNLNDPRWKVEQLPDLAAARDWPGNGVVAAIDPYLVTCGGWSDNTRTCQKLQLSNDVSEIGNWTEIDLPKGMCGRRVAVGVHQSRVFVSGGNCPGQESVVYSMDPETENWRQEPAMIYERFEHSMASFNGALIACGGYTKEYVTWGSCEALVDGASAWFEIEPMNTKRTQFSLISLDDKLMAFGGYNGFRQVNTVDILASGQNVMQGIEWAESDSKLPDGIWRWKGYTAIPEKFVERYVKNWEE